MHSRATLPGVRKANPFAVIVISARLQACVLSNLHLQYTYFRHSLRCMFEQHDKRARMQLIILVNMFIEKEAKV